jgi:nucleoside-diphosphate-sugar epimerase
VHGILSGTGRLAAMTILLAGCGDLGTEAGLRFAAAGYRVVGWRRTPEKLPAAIEGSAADLSTAELPPVPADTTAVVVAVAADSPTEAAYRAAYIDGLSHVLDALERDGVTPRRVLFISSTAVYGDADGGWVDEGTTPAPGGFSGRILREAEELLTNRLRGTGTAPVVLRLGGIYGPGRTRLIDQVRGGTAVIPAEPRYTNRIHRDDAAGAIVHLCTMAEDPAPVYLGVDDDPAELGDVLRFLASELGLEVPPSGSAGEPRGGNKRCSNALLRGTGFSLAYPTFREGYRDILAGVGVRHP